MNTIAGLPSSFYRVRDRSILLDPPTVLGNRTVQLVAHNSFYPEVELQFSSNLVNWVSLAVVTNAGPVFTNFDVSGTNWPTRFYRSVAVP